MVELWYNPSGEVALSTAPDSNANLNSALSAEDSAKIMELRNTIASLKQEIEMVMLQ